MYHVRANGEYGKCSAKKEKCPYASEENTVHVETKKDAEMAACKIYSSQYGQFNKVQKPKHETKTTTEALALNPELIHTKRTYKKSPTTKRGYAHEYQLAEYISKMSNGKAWIDQSNAGILKTRKDYFDSIKEENPEEAAELSEWASNSAKLLPPAVGPVMFTETAANGDEVYDVIYRDKTGKHIKVSAKLAETEDKAYRFNTQGNLLQSSVKNLEKAYAGVEVGKDTHEEALAKNGYTVSSLQQEMVQDLAQGLKEKNEDYDTLLRLTDESFIGRGGYVKTLPNGYLRDYPLKEDGDTVELVNPENIRNDKTSIYYDVALKNKDGEVKQRYAVQFRIKYKDGKSKPVKVNSTGVPNNIAATVSLKLFKEPGDLGYDPNEEH